MIHICLAVCLSFYIYLHGASNLFDRGDNLEEKRFWRSGQAILVYTEKFGMIMASAKGVRLEKSKLRGNLDIFTYGDFAVISSKDFWSLVDAIETVSPKLNCDSAECLKVLPKRPTSWQE